MCMCGDTHLPGHAIKVRGTLQALFFPFTPRVFWDQTQVIGLSRKHLIHLAGSRAQLPLSVRSSIVLFSVILYAAVPIVIFDFLFHLFLPSSGTRMLMDQICVSSCAADIQLACDSSFVRRPLLKEWLRVRLGK